LIALSNFSDIEIEFRDYPTQFLNLFTYFDIRLKNPYKKSISDVVIKITLGNQ